MRPCTGSGHRLRRGRDPYARFVYIDTFNSVYGPGWKRDTGIVTHQRNGAFCYSFVAQVPPPGYPSSEPRGPGNGERHRVTVMGPGVTPVVRWEGRGLRHYDAAADRVFNRRFDRLVGDEDRVCRARALSSPRFETRQPLRLFARDIDPVDTRASRAFAEEGDESLDRVALTLEHRLDAPVRPIQHPPGYPLGQRAPARRLAEEDALDTTLDVDAAALHALYANPVTMSFVERIAAARIGETFNQYAGSSLLRRRLAAYLAARSGAPILLVAEAPGYRGTRVSGIPLTSERQLTGTGPAEGTATIVHAVLAGLGIESDVLLWNVVPTHPGTACSNRAPTRQEVEESAPFLAELSDGRRVIAVGRVAHACIGGPYIRHPSHGGAAAFRSGLSEALR